MKKLLFILLLILSKTSFSAGLYFTVVGASFDTNTAVVSNSQQWIDVIQQGNYFASDTIKIHMFHVNKNWSSLYLLPYKLIYQNRFYPDYLNLPYNPDSVSKRIYFNMPSSFDSVRFQVSINSSGKAFGNFLDTNTYVIDTTHIDTTQIDTTKHDTIIVNGFGELQLNKKPILEINYFDANGKSCPAGKGFFIEQFTYSDGTIKRRKIVIE
jgi:hypothetical protein